MDLAGDPKRVTDPSVATGQIVDNNAPMTSSRFFAPHATTTSNRTPTILVPGSSPDSSPAPLAYVPKMGHHPPTNGRAPPSTAALFAGRMMQDERLSAGYSSSSIPLSAGSSDASSSRSASVRRRDDVEDGAPPRKKLNMGPGSFTSLPSSSSTTRQSTPDSLQGVRSGVRTMGVIDPSPNTTPEKPRGRLVKGRGPPAASPSLPATPNLAVRPAVGTTFKNTTPLDHLIKGNPSIPPLEMQRQYQLQGHDASRTVAAIGGMVLVLYASLYPVTDNSGLLQAFD